MKEGDGLPSWILLQSTGATGDGTFTLLEQALPFDAELGEQGATIHNRLGPRITDVDGDGTPDVLLPIGNVFTIFRSVGSQQDLLPASTMGSTRTIRRIRGMCRRSSSTTGPSIDKAITDGPAALPAAEDGYDYLSKGWFAPSCAYPLRCVVGPRRVVSEYSRNNGADKLRRSRVQYRGGRYDRRGRGFLGFQAKITTDLDTGSGNIELYGDASEVDVGTVKTYPEAGQLREAIRWTPNPRPQDPDRIELSFTTIQRELRSTNGGATYFLMPTEVAQARKQGKFSPGGAQTLHPWLQLSAKASSTNVGGSTVSTTDYDDYGNVLAAVTTTAEVDLTTTISDVKYNNHPDSWLIGQLANRTECSTAANLKQCRTVTRTYDDTTGLLEDEIVDAEGDATMHLAITYGRDAFGNITSTTADDKLGNHRASWTTYEPSGVFPDKHGNAVGHVVVPAFDSERIGAVGGERAPAAGRAGAADRGCGPRTRSSTIALMPSSVRRTAVRSTPLGDVLDHGLGRHRGRTMPACAAARRVRSVSTQRVEPEVLAVAGARPTGLEVDDHLAALVARPAGRS